MVEPAGFGAAPLGTAAGAAEVVVGTSPWLGNKNDPTTLGSVTVFLALAVAAAGWAWRWATTTLRAVAVATGMLVPALLGTTTAGVAWLPAGVVAALGGVGALRHGAILGSIQHAVREQWSAILLGCLALIHVALGVIAGGGTGVLAVSGGLAVVAAMPLHRRSRTAATVVLGAGTLPFGAVAWWSVAAPLTGTLILVIGLPLVLSKVLNGSGPPGPGAPESARGPS
jgi:hypothetical protein